MINLKEIAKKMVEEELDTLVLPDVKHCESVHVYLSVSSSTEAEFTFSIRPHGFWADTLKVKASRRGKHYTWSSGGKKDESTICAINFHGALGMFLEMNTGDVDFEFIAQEVSERLAREHREKIAEEQRRKKEFISKLEADGYSLRTEDFLKEIKDKVKSTGRTLEFTSLIPQIMSRTLEWYGYEEEYRVMLDGNRFIFICDGYKITQLNFKEYLKTRYFKGV